MKKNDEKKRYRIIIKIFCFLAIYLIGAFNTNAQDPPLSFESNISLPERSLDNYYSSGALDVITANGKVFVCTGDKIMVMSTNGQSVVATIPFDEKYGKYDPVLYNPRLHVSDINLMTVFINEDQGDREDIFVVTPSLDILLVNTDDYTTQLKASIPSDPAGLDLSHFKPLHGVCIIKYDDVHNRLYWVIKGRQIDSQLPNCTGAFHYREIYFAIYDATTSGYLTRYYYFNEISLPSAPAHYHNINISDVEFNRNDDPNENDYFYLAKFNKIEVWEFDDDPNNNIEVQLKHEIEVPNDIYGYNPESGYPNHYKFSKLLYVNEQITGGAHVHKVVALPYSFPGYELEPGKSPLIYVIDCNNTDMLTVDFVAAQVSTIISPNQRVYDAVYLPERNDLAICYSANPVDYADPTDNTDMAFYRFNPNAGDWLNLINKLSTSINPVPGKDINSPTNLLQVNNATLASKKDEVISLTYSLQDNAYQASVPLVTGENNFFRKGVVRESPDKCFVLNTGGGKIEMFDYVQGSTAITHVDNYRTYYPVYHTTANQSGTKQYFFNKLNIENSGFFISQQQSAINVNDDQYTNNDFTSPIGDVVYNNFTNEFLVSQNNDLGDNAAAIKRYEADGQVYHEIVLQDPVSGIEYQYAKEMFIDPNGTLYVMVNTVVGDINIVNSPPNNPYMLLYDATTYEHISSFELTMPHEATAPPYFKHDAEYYMAHFCWSKSNNTVYFTVTPQELTLPPYQSEFNSMFNSAPAYSPNKGRLFSIDNGILTTEVSSLDNPGKIICPDDGDESIQSDFEGWLYVLSSQIYTFNYTNKNGQFENKRLNDIVYSPHHDKLFALADEETVNSCPDDRTSVLYEIAKGPNGGFVFTELLSEPGQSAAFFLNPHDNKLYLHTKFDNGKLGGTPAQLIQYDVATDVSNTVPLQDGTYDQNRSFYPELDHCPDYYYHNYNLTTPYIDPYQNKIYLPNGGHSNVSVVGFDADEPLLLNNETWSWFSFPRLNMDNGNPTVHDVLYGPDADRIDPMGYRIDSELQNIEIGGTELLTNTFDGTDWPLSGQNLDDVDNKFGYKLFLNYDNPQPDQKRLFLSGNLIQPDEAILTLAGENKENWVGYYLLATQSPFDAIADDIEENLSVIKAQYWVCYNDSPASEGPLWCCASNKGKVELKYGDMAIIKTNDYVDVPGFQWLYYGNTMGGLDREGTLFYEYNETADYTPIFIELDTTENPLEIGAFIDDSCVGATTVMPDDTLLLIPTYTEGLSGEIYFEEYNGTQKLSSPPISEYWVKNNGTKSREKRAIHTREKKDYYVVSFKPVVEQPYAHAGQWFDVYPNPADNMLNISYGIAEDAKVNISVFDGYGRRAATLMDADKPVGTHTMQWNLAGDNGTKLPKGLYIIKIEVDGNTMSRKVVVN